MSKTVLNFNKEDYKQTPLFLGPDLSIQRYDNPKYKKIFANFKQSLSFFWRPEEIALGGKERNEFNNLAQHERDIFTDNLSYQILLDSVVSRGAKYIADCVSNPELEAAMTMWAAFETIHSYSYTYIIKDIFPKPEEIFDKILDNPAITKRAESVTKYYDDLIDCLPETTDYEKKKKLYLALVSVNILEGIRFYVSFACSYAFAQNKKMEGNAKIIELINRDENIHLALSQLLIKTLRTEESEGFMDVANDCEEIVYEMYKVAANEEMEWAKYLFRNGSILGLNDEILTKYMKFLTNKRLKGIGLKSIFDQHTNPISWMDNWTESAGVQVAPQETEQLGYLIGAFKQDIDDVDWKSEFEI